MIKKLLKVRREKLKRLLDNDPTAKRVFDSLKKVGIDLPSALTYSKEKYNYSELLFFAKKFFKVDGNNSRLLKMFIREMLRTKNRDQRKEVMARPFHPSLSRPFKSSTPFPPFWWNTAHVAC